MVQSLLPSKNSKHLHPIFYLLLTSNSHSSNLHCNYSSHRWKIRANSSVHWICSKCCRIIGNTDLDIFYQRICRDERFCCLHQVNLFLWSCYFAIDLYIGLYGHVNRARQQQVAFCGLTPVYPVPLTRIPYPQAVMIDSCCLKIVISTTRCIPRSVFIYLIEKLLTRR